MHSPSHPFHDGSHPDHTPDPVPASAPAAEGGAPIAHHHEPVLGPHAESKWHHVPLDVKDDVFEQATTFESMGLRSSVIKGLKAAGFSYPTKIQAQLIPPIMAGKDVLGQAKTGTGKTAAFALPLLHKCDKDTPSQALVLVPTRELCLQVAREFNELGQFTPIHACAVYGGERIKTQVDALQRNPQIIVSTPGRLMDMVQRGFVRLNNVRHAVLDEVDRMLDIGFRDDIRKILGQCPPPGPDSRQTIFTSATISPEIERLARAQSKDAEKIIAITKGALTTALVKQFYLAVQPWDKRKLLLHLLTHEDPALTIVFCRMKRTVDEVCEYLNKHKIDAHAMHGDMMQNKRNRVIDRLHKGDLSVLVASDLASRGLDIDGITHVINYDLPEDPEVYVHRIGRTARIGREGVAWSFATPEQGDLLTNIEMLINMEVPKLDYPDFTPSPPPRGREGMGGGRSGPGVPPSAEVKVAPPPGNRYTASVNPTVPIAQAAAPSPDRYPGGVVPSKLPPKRMFGRVKTSRSGRGPSEAPPPAAAGPESPPPAAA